jgi:1,4-alpha-glucan branching enzyme
MLWLLAGCASLGGSASGNDPTQQVSFFYEDPHAKTVCIVGSFNAWAIGADPLVKAGAGEWKGSLRLPKGVHQYMYVVDGRTWVKDPRAFRTLEDGFGRMNGLLVVE